LPYKAALARTPRFRESVERYARELLKSHAPVQAELVEVMLGTKNDAPSSAELERLTRDFFSIEMHAIAVGEGACLRAEIQFDAHTGSCNLQKRRYPLAVERLFIPSDEWVKWFVHGERCLSCGLFPDHTDEYLPCHLCGYADYEMVEDARDRFLRSVADPGLVTAVRRLLDTARAETDPVRTTYLRYRLYRMWNESSSAHEPLPW
jgi:hypothetical protein